MHAWFFDALLASHRKKKKNYLTPCKNKYILNIFQRINNQILVSFGALIIISLVHWLFYLFFYNKIFHADLWRLTSRLTAWEVAVSIANETGWRNIMNIMIAIYAFWLEVKPKFNINKSTFCHSSILNRVLNSKQTKYILLFFYS